MAFSNLDRLAWLGLFAALACESTNDPSDGGGGSGGSAAGQSSGGVAAGGAGAANGGATNGGAANGGATTGGAANGGVATGGAASGGVATGGGSATAGSAGATAGSAGASGGVGGVAGTGGSGGKSKTTFFVTSDKSMTGKLGGLEGADKRCQDLAKAASIGDHTFHAYLSTAAVNAKDRIGQGPWFNSAGVMLAADLTALHALKGNAELFLDENKKKINGQWQGSPTPNEHDVLTGSNADGTVRAGFTCMDWTSDATNLMAQVGHSDGLGPQMNGAAPYNSWNSAHENGNCGDTAPKGGAGRLYCFAID